MEDLRSRVSVPLTHLVEEQFRWPGSQMVMRGATEVILYHCAPPEKDTGARQRSIRCQDAVQVSGVAHLPAQSLIVALRKEIEGGCASSSHRLFIEKNELRQQGPVIRSELPPCAP